MTKFKPYNHKGSIIYSPKNRKFLEKFAETITDLSKEERLKAAGNKVTLGGITYLLLIGSEREPNIYLVSESGVHKTRGTVFLAEQ